MRKSVVTDKISYDEVPCNHAVLLVHCSYTNNKGQAEVKSLLQCSCPTRWQQSLGKGENDTIVTPCTILYMVVASAPVWNERTCHVMSEPSLQVSCSRLKTRLFSCFFPNFCSAREVTCIIIGHYNHFCYLLNY